MKNRKKHFANVTRIVVKIGTNILTKKNGDANATWVRQFAEVIHSLRQNKYEVIVVSSGAIGAGRHMLHMGTRPQSLAEKQAVAAIGQTRLMRVYKDAFSKLNIPVAQILLTYDDLDSRLRTKNAVNTVEHLLSLSALPIINENDTVAVEEIKFGDNDFLSALVTNFTHSDALILLTNVDGILENPHAPADKAHCIHTVSLKTWHDAENGITDDTSEGGTGGMRTKIKAARAVVEQGGIAVIANGNDTENIKRILNGETIGTLCIP